MKKLDVEFYRLAKADFITNLKRRNVTKWDELNAEISLYCACTGLPVLAAIVFVEEEFPEYSEQLTKKKEVVKTFYGY